MGRARGCDPDRHDLAGAAGGEPEAADGGPGFLLWRAANLWQRGVRAALAPSGLTHAQFALLLAVCRLGRGGAPVTQARLATHAGTDQMMTSQVVRVLARRGLVARRRHPADARAVVVAATPRGRAQAARALRLVAAHDAAFFATAGRHAAVLQHLLRGLLSDAE